MGESLFYVVLSQPISLFFLDRDMRTTERDVESEV